MNESHAVAKISAQESCPHGSIVNMNVVGSRSTLTISSLIPSTASYRLCCSMSLASSFPFVNACGGYLSLNSSNCL